MHANGRPSGDGAAPPDWVDAAVLRSAVELQHEVDADGADLGAAMHRIAERTRELTGASAAHVTKLEGSELITGASVGDEELRLPPRFAATGALTLHAIRSRESVLCRDTEADE